MFDAYLDDFICEVTCEEYWGDWDDWEEDWGPWDEEYDPVPATYEMIQDGHAWYAEVEATIDLDEWSDW